MKFQLKKSDEISGTSALAPNTSYLEFGEIVVNYNAADPKLFFKLSDNSLGQIGITTSAGTPTTLEATGSSAVIPKVVLNRSQGTVSSPSDLVDGNTIGTVVAKGYYSGSYTEMGSLNWLYDYTSGSNTGPGSQFEIKTSVRTNNSNTFNAPATRIKIDENGNTRIGGNLAVGLLNTNPSEKICVYNGSIYSEMGYKLGGSPPTPQAELSTNQSASNSRLQIKLIQSGTLQEVARIGEMGIGFGTTSPSAAFHGETANETLGYFRRTNTGNVVLRFRNTTSDMYCGLTTNATGFAIDDDSNLGDAPQFFIERTTGNIGVNTAAPARKFVVDGGADNIIGSFTSTDAGSYISFSDNTTSSDSQVRVGAVGNEMVLQSAGSSTLRLDASNNARFFGNLQVDGSFTELSDISLKENIEIIPNALEKIHQIRGITYKRKDIEGYRQAGVIAQEVEKVLPEVVHDDPTGIKSVAYGNLVSLLIEAVKEQQSQIEALTKRVNQMENN